MKIKEKDIISIVKFTLCLNTHASMSEEIVQSEKQSKKILTTLNKVSKSCGTNSNVSVHL